MRKPELTKGALIVGVFSLLAAGSWVGFDLYRVVVKTTLPQVLRSQIEPLPTKIDEELINNLRGRRRLDEVGLDLVESVPVPGAEVGAAVPTVTPVVTPRPLATESAQPAEATTSGGI